MHDAYARWTCESYLDGDDGIVGEAGEEWLDALRLRGRRSSIALDRWG